MKASRRRRMLLGMGTVVGLTLIGLSIVGWQWRQDRLDAALCQAIYDYDLKTTTMLLDQGANPNATYPIPTLHAPNHVPFWSAVWNRLLHHKPDGHRIAALLVPVSREFGYEAGYVSTMRALTSVLLQHGADPNVRDSYGCTPLFYAARPGDVKAVRLLLEHHADPNSTNSYGESPLCYGNLGTVRLLVAYGAIVNAPCNPFFMACEHDDYARAQFLLEHGANPNAVDRAGQPLLSYLLDGDVKTVEWMLQHGTKVSGGRPGMSEMMLCRTVSLGRPDMTDLLLPYGARANRRYMGKTALDVARRLPYTTAKRTAIIRLLEDASRKERAASR